MIVRVDTYLVCDCDELGCPIPIVHIHRLRGPSREHKNVSRDSLNRLAKACRERMGVFDGYGDGWTWSTVDHDVS
jgi:hypothetical protein